MNNTTGAKITALLPGITRMVARFFCRNNDHCDACGAVQVGRTAIDINDDQDNNALLCEDCYGIRRLQDWGR